MYVAQPSIFNTLNSKEFPTIQGAKLYLDNFTGYKMTVDEWCILGKILEVDKDGKLLPSAVDIDSFL